jgi:hypothetical protein
MADDVPQLECLGYIRKDLIGLGEDSAQQRYPSPHVPNDQL